MTLEIFLMMLLVVSTLTGLVTEALKIWLDEHKKQVFIFTCQKREEMLLNKLHITYRKEEV